MQANLDRGLADEGYFLACRMDGFMHCCWRWIHSHAGQHWPSCRSTRLDCVHWSDHLLPLARDPPAMTGLNYPDNLYADHEERKARARQAPVGACRAPTEMPESERKLRTALAYVNHARDLIREALGDTMTAERIAKVAAGNPATVPGYPIEGVPPERVPKWDSRWAAEQSRDGVLKDIRDYGSAFVRHTWEDGRLVVTHVPLENVYVANPTSSQPPNCAGLSARDIRSPHPMQAEAIRDHDERLSGAEDRL